MKTTRIILLILIIIGLGLLATEKIWVPKLVNRILEHEGIEVTAFPTVSSINYTNNRYGFSVTLPPSWQGYTVVTGTWTGYTTPAEHGPIFSIRNPLWASSTPRQDIPIMVFTLNEWSAVNSGTMSVSAAPIPPSELGQNAQYVFALPARYNYAYPEGWQEVQSIIQSNPLHAF